MNKEIEELINHEKFIATKPYIRKLGEVINTLEYLRTAIYHEEIDTKKAFEAGQKDKEAQIEKMEKYKKSLIYEYVTGKKRVKGAV